MVVRTQKIRCKIIPNMKKQTNVRKYEKPEKYDIMYAPIIVIITSAIATPNKR